MSERFGVLNKLREDVIQANTFREKGKHQEVERIFRKWLDPQNGQFILPDESKSISLQEIAEAVKIEQEEENVGEFSLIAVGILGLARIWHVDLNNLISQNRFSVKNTDTTSIEQSLNEIKVIYEILENATHISRTIEGSGINWQLEINHDLGKTAELFGSRDEAIHHYLESIKGGRRQLETISDPIHYAGTLSSIAVHELRLGIYSNNPHMIDSAISDQLLSNETQFNRKRTLDFAKMILKASLKDTGNWLHPIFRKNVMKSIQLFLKYSLQSQPYEKTA